MTVCSLRCQCLRYYIDVLPLSPGCENRTCSTDKGVCIVELNVYDGAYSFTYACIGERGDFNHVQLACSLKPTPSHVVLCCNASDYCNEHLRPELLLPPVLSQTPIASNPPSPSPVTDSDNNKGN